MKVVIMVTAIILSLQLFASEPPLMGTTWELVYMDIEDLGLEDISTSNFKESLGDLDGDGVEESYTMKIYKTFHATHLKVYMMMEYCGSQSYFESMGLDTVFTYTESEYMIEGNTILSEEEETNYEIKDGNLIIKDNKNRLTVFKPNNLVDLSLAQKDTISD